MTYRRKILTASIVACLITAANVHAQDAQNVRQPPATPNGASSSSSAPAAADPAGGSSAANPGEELDTIVVLGIRESLKKSLEKKRDADAIIDAITAEDIGKFPATNVAEALAQIPGVTIDRAL